MEDEDTEAQTVPVQKRHGPASVLQNLLTGHGQGRGPRRSSQITAAVLRELINEDPATVLIRLSRTNSGLIDFLRKGDLSIDAIKLVLCAFGKACQCESMSESLNTMITNILLTPFLDVTLSRLLNQLQMQKNGDDEVVKNCLPLLKELLVRMPTDGWKKVQEITVWVQVLWQKGGMRNDDINKRMLQLTELLVRSQPPPPQVAGGAQPMDNDNEEPPENFRELPIIPRKDELDGTVDIFLLPNKIDGGFRNLEHYLECQFRLFRADVILPLKESIIDFQTVGEDTSVGLRIYTDVQIVRPVCTHNGIAYRIAFDTRPLKHVRWDSSRRLIFGSLLCLSSDNFKDNMIFATVDQRDKELVRNGLVDVLFLSNQDQVAGISRDIRFAMVESQAYFESYKYILQGMQQLTERNFPFQKYIVECENSISEPLYLRQQQDILYDLRPLLYEDFKINDETNLTFDQTYPSGSEIANNVKLQDISTWPLAEFLHLDNSQLTALRNALTREFALIQGPPGTGKTYVGVKILKTLLHNSKVWLQGQRRLPILIVCYTNHALDQFLEATLEFFKGSLVRVGSQSKSELMQDHSLKNARQRIRELRALPTHVHAGKLETLREMTTLKVDIHTKAARLEVAEREIVHERCLKEFMAKRVADYFPSETEYQSCHILAWLGVQKELFDIEQEGEYLRHQLEELRVGPGDEEEDYETDEETIDLTGNQRSTRQLEEDIMDDEFEFDDGRDRGRILDADIQRIRRECIGLDVTKLDVTVESLFLSKDLKEIMQEKQRRKKALKFKLIKRIRSTDRMIEAETERVRNIWKMSYKERWRLYRYWVDLLCRQAKAEIRDKEDTYRRLAMRYREVLMQEDRVILQNCTIIGMTTTVAARYQSILNEIGPKIIMVEEAAEVLEAHVIGTLSRECQHLILIGDHKQLRPNPTVNKLAKRYNLEISLFERMVQNGLNCDTLAWQHRMRPEIADVIRPLYKNLKDHEVVTTYENVKGVTKNVFFINHQAAHEKEEETKSFRNEHEAKYMVALCKYLIKQGYQTDRITILTTYSAQMHHLKNMMPKSQFDGVRVVAVDSYQGEENDIILLSLVRSGEENTIGFLAADNRVCVALSRAKIGLYVIGNFNYITEYSPLMKEICTRAQQSGKMGPALPLSCQNHPADTGIEAKIPRDFERLPEGGCTKPCEFRLQCGHVCPRMCHASDQEHKNAICSKPCKRKCSHCNNITCTNPCYMPCTPCPILVSRRLPRCGHTQNIECQDDVLNARCEEKCAEVLSCGHPCHGKCGEMHPRCTEPVDVTRSCGHAVQVECGSRNTAPCNKPCETILTCEHPCQGNCGKCYQGRLHHPCTAACTKTLICGHQCQSSCSNCPPCSRPCENRCNHSKCGKKCGEPCASCKEECQWKCRHYKCNTPCGDICDRPRCNDPCRKKPLSCGHACIGVCGEPCPKLCRICNADEVTQIFFGSEDEPNAHFIELEDCHHIFEMKGLDQYMDGPEDENDTVVKLKGCPKCQTPIRRNLRYGNIIKQALNEIEKVKLKERGNEGRITTLKASINKCKNRLSPADLAVVSQLVDSFPVPSETILSTQNNQIMVFRQLISMERMVKECVGKFRCDEDTYGPLLRQVKDFKRWVMLRRSCYSTQEVEDTKREMEHLCLLKYLIDARGWIDLDKKEVPPRIMRNLVAMIRQLESPSVLSEDLLAEAQRMKDDVKEYVPGSGIGVTDEERLKIVEAIGLNRGHWYKCKRGHVYAIGECGRAAEEATCPECGGAIGGVSHELSEDNAWAPEMDDAEELPFSEERDYLLALQLQYG